MVRSVNHLMNIIILKEKPKFTQCDGNASQAQEAIWIQNYLITFSCRADAGEGMDVSGAGLSSKPLKPQDWCRKWGSEVTSAEIKVGSLSEAPWAPTGPSLIYHLLMARDAINASCNPSESSQHRWITCRETSDSQVKRLLVTGKMLWTDVGLNCSNKFGQFCHFSFVNSCK